MDQLNLWLLIIFVFFQVVDFYSTKRIIIDRGGREVNPILSRLFDAVGVIPGLIISKGVISAVMIYFTIANMGHWLIMTVLAALIFYYTAMLIKYNIMSM